MKTYNLKRFKNALRGFAIVSIMLIVLTGLVIGLGKVIA